MNWLTLAGIFLLCSVHLQISEGKSHKNDVFVVDSAETVIDGNEWYYQEYPEGYESPDGKAGFWRLPDGQKPSNEEFDKGGLFYYVDYDYYWRQALPSDYEDPVVVPGWEDDYDGIIEVPSDDVCAVLDPNQWEIQDGVWVSKPGVELSDSVKNADCIEYVEGDPGHWQVKPDAKPGPAFIPGSEDVDKEDNGIPYYLIDDDKNIVMYEDDFYFDKEEGEWKLKPDVLPDYLDEDDFEFYEYPDGKEGPDGQIGYWRPKEDDQNPILVVDPDENGGDVVVDYYDETFLEIDCKEDDTVAGWVSIEPKSCTDSGHKNEERACNLMYDDNISRRVQDGGCYVSTGSYKTWANIQLKSKAPVHQVLLASKMNGRKLPGTEIHVCSTDDDSSCVYCSTIEETEREKCTSLTCETVIEGSRIKLSGEKNGMAICDIAIMSEPQEEEQVSCDKAAGNEGLQEVELVSCKDSGTAGKAKQCENIFDSVKSQVVSDGGCFVSQGTWKVFAEVDFASRSSVTSVSVLGKSNGERLKGTVVSVCSNGICKKCAEFGEPSTDECNTLTCESELSGTSIKLENKKDGIVVCDMAVFGNGAAPEPEPEEISCDAAPGMEGESTVSLASCSDSGTSGDGNKCENMWDDNKSQTTSDGGCYVSQGSTNTFAEVQFAQRSTVTAFSILPKANGDDLKNTKVSVCDNGKCTKCKKIGKVIEGCNTFNCLEGLTGTSMYFENKQDGIVICDLAVFGTSAGELVVEGPPTCKDNAPTGQDLLSFKSCIDSGTSGDKRKCENLYDDNPSQNANEGGCYVSKGSYKVFAEVKFVKRSSVKTVGLLGKTNGDKLKGTVAYVCDNGICEKCGSIKEVSTDECNVINCGSELTGTALRLENPNDGIVVCDMAAYGTESDEDAVEGLVQPQDAGKELFIHGCADSGTKTEDTNCENLYDGDERRGRDDGACYSSKGTYKVYAEAHFDQAKPISRVYLLSRDNGNNIEGANVEVCADVDTDCSLCGTVGKPELNSYNKVDCGSPIKGKVVRFTNPGQKLEICEVKIFRD